MSITVLVPSVLNARTDDATGTGVKMGFAPDWQTASAGQRLRRLTK